MQDALLTTWFDGRSPKGQAVSVVLVDGQLRVQGEGVDQSYLLRRVRWPEKSRHGPRLCDLPDGSSLQHTDSVEWDDWFERQGFRPSWIEACTLRWRTVMVAVLGIVVIAVAAWRWGIPAASVWVAPRIPVPLQQRIGSQALDQIRDMWLKPSSIPLGEQSRLRDRFEEMVQVAYAHEASPNSQRPVPWRLHFYQAPLLQANAFALPGGDMVLTDGMVEMLRDQPDALMGVLAHELGHVKHHHGMQMVIRTSLMSALVGAVIGDVGSFLTAIPMVLATQGYARDAEREADQAAALFLHRNGIHPRAMVVLFERMRSAVAKKADDPSTSQQDILPIGLASHPSDAQRIAFFKNWQP